MSMWGVLIWGLMSPSVSPIRVHRRVLSVWSFSPLPSPAFKQSLFKIHPGEEPRDSLPTACFVLKPILSKEEGFVVAVIFKSLKGCPVLVNVEN